MFDYDNTSSSLKFVNGERLFGVKLQLMFTHLNELLHEWLIMFVKREITVK